LRPFYNGRKGKNDPGPNEKGFLSRGFVDPSIGSLSRDHVTDPAFRVGHIALPPRDQVDVAMENALSRNESRVCPDVEAPYGRITGENPLLDEQQEVVAGEQLFLRQAEIVDYMPPGNDKGMQFRHGKPVPDSEGKLVLGNDAVLVHVAEEALVFPFHSFPFPSFRSGFWREPDLQQLPFSQHGWKSLKG
jgi:hypothetical protein